MQAGWVKQNGRIAQGRTRRHEPEIESIEGNFSSRKRTERANYCKAIEVRTRSDGSISKTTKRNLQVGSWAKIRIVYCLKQSTWKEMLPS
jgi:hypothetical protein